jgi:hypothetical protein
MVYQKTVQAISAVGVLVYCVAASATLAAVDKTTADFWNNEYREFSGQIADRSMLAKKSTGDERSVVDRNALVFDTDRDPADIVIRRTEALLADLSANGLSSAKAASFRERLAAIKQGHVPKNYALGKVAAASASLNPDATYLAAQELNREIMMASPQLDFTDLLFIERGILVPGSEIDGDHMCDQYYGHNARTGGGMYILKNFATSPQKVNIMTGLTVPSGTNKGKAMTSGTFLSPDLSFDGKTIVFSWSSGGKEKWKPENRFNIFSVNVDGTGLKRLTDGDFDEIHPCWLPGGRIAFISTRRTGYGRCHGRSVPTYTLYSMKPDGSDIICLSFHETNEWHPSVANDGRLIYTRWDYIDRDFSAAHHLWYCNPDGTNPRSWGGNYSFPLNTLGSGPFQDQRSARPWAEYNGRSIPGSASKVVATAGPHHGQAYGSLVLIDFNIPDDNKMAQITRLTPDAPFPEGSTAWRAGYVYGTAWPLSESQYLCNYNNTIILFNKSGSKQQLYTTTGDQVLRPIYPIPLRARPEPPAISAQTQQGERWSTQTPKATLNVMNVNVTDDYGKLPAGTQVKSMRIIQILPKCTPLADNPKIGYGAQDNARMVLGTVPVESDGSVYCDAPIGKAIYFQLLDEKGMAVQSMRSVTYVHPGEQLSCVGCHEDKWKAPPAPSVTLASQRDPSKITPEAGGIEPVNFYRLVKPVFDGKCQPCHVQNGKGPQNMSYASLEPYAFYYTGGGDNFVPNHGGSRNTPGKFGSQYARMGKAMLSTTHQKAVTDGKFTAADMRRVTLWLDCNSDEFGTYYDINLQRAGQLVWPRLDVDPQDPLGLDYQPFAMEEKGLWVKVDDGNSAITYSAGWNGATNTSGYGSTNHSVSTSGATATFTFTGIGARFHGFKRNDLGIADVFVDGTKKTSIDCYSADAAYDQVLYQIVGLTAGEHTVKVALSGSKNSASRGTGVVIDAFSYCKQDLSVAIARPAAPLRYSVMVRALGRPIMLPVSFAGKPFSLSILGLDGRLVRQISVDGRTASVPAGDGVVGRGVYIVRCRTNETVFTQRIMKMR